MTADRLFRAEGPRRQASEGQGVGGGLVWEEGPGEGLDGGEFMLIGGLELQDKCLGGEVGFIHVGAEGCGQCTKPPQAWRRGGQTPAHWGGFLPYGSLDVWQTGRHGGRLGTVRDAREIKERQRIPAAMESRPRLDRALRPPVGRTGLAESRCARPLRCKSRRTGGARQAQSEGRDGGQRMGGRCARGSRLLRATASGLGMEAHTMRRQTTASARGRGLTTSALARRRGCL